MHWTTQKPSQPGWYKWRHYPKKKAYTVEVRKMQGVLEVCWMGEVVARFDEPVEGQWAGPIPEPAEEEEVE